MNTKDETEAIEGGLVEAKTDREPSRLAARGVSPPVENAGALPVVRMLRPGTVRSPTEDRADCGAGSVNCKL